MVERRGQARRPKAAADIAHGVAMAVQGLGNGLIRKRFSLVAIQQQQNPSPRVCPGRRAARPDQGIEYRTLVVS